MGTNVKLFYTTNAFVGFVAGTTSDLYNYDELRIVDILTVYFSSGCTGQFQQ